VTLYHVSSVDWYLVLAGNGQGLLGDYTITLENDKTVNLKQAFSPADYWQPGADYGPSNADPYLLGSR
jgi:hypothetical protein